MACDMRCHLHVDIETRSPVDLMSAGAYRYAEHPDTEIILVAYAIDDQPVRVFEPLNERAPREFIEAFADPGVAKIAHNAAFERALFHHGRAPRMAWTPPDQWWCTQVMAQSLSFPGSLKAVAECLKLEQKKDAAGTRLINLFSIIKNGVIVDPGAHPDDWQKFRDYCVQDVEVERAIFAKLSKFMAPPQEWKLWSLDQKINTTGLPIDRAFVERSIIADGAYREMAMERAREITGVDNPNSRDQILAWIREQGVDIGDCRSATLEEIKPTVAPHIAEVISLRQGLSKSSIKKYYTLQDATCQDDRLRGCFQFMGAGRTGRWSGRLFQPQNLARPSVDDLDTAREAVGQGYEFLDALYGDEVPEVLSSLIRSTIAAPEGKKLVAVDFSSIEVVMLAWAAGCEVLLSALRKGLDPYKEYATHAFNIAYETVTKAQRTFAKPATLGCGYMLGTKGLVDYAGGMGITLTEEEAEHCKVTYRKAYPEIPQFWYAVDDAAKDCVQTKRTRRVGRFTFRYASPFLFIDLPSGRSLAYFRPKLEERQMPWGDYKLVLTYEGQDTFTKKWTRLATHPGKIVENIVQAISRDLLAHALLNLDANGEEIVGHVHDEVIVLADVDDVDALQRVTDLCVALPAWANGAPIGASGYEAKYYRKD